jgi:hypothetical protein
MYLSYGGVSCNGSKFQSLTLLILIFFFKYNSNILGVGVYTNVVSYLDWINTQMAIN